MPLRQINVNQGGHIIFRMHLVTFGALCNFLLSVYFMLTNDKF